MQAFFEPNVFFVFPFIRTNKKSTHKALFP
jgi:hypothetical protein